MSEARTTRRSRPRTGPAPDTAIDATPEGGVLDALTRHWNGTHVVDEWGLDPDWLSAASWGARLRWHITLGGAEHVPAAGPVLIVANHRPLAGTVPILAAAVRQASGRALRATGILDVTVIGPTMRRVGGVIGRPDEVASLLRHGEMVGVWARPEWHLRGRVGRVSQDMVAPALATGALVLPAAVVAMPWSRSTRVEIGAPVAITHRMGPLGPAELADATRSAIQRLIDESTPPRWPLPG